MNDVEEFAPQYTTKERNRFIASSLAACLFFIWLWTMWGLPWIKWSAERAHCTTVWGHPGTEVLFFAVFVGIPLLVMLPSLAIGWTGIKVIRQQQTPLKNTKVFKPTKIVRGKLAKRRGILMLLVAPLFLAMAVWGYFQADALSKKVQLEQPNTSTCNMNPTFKARRWRH